MDAARAVGKQQLVLSDVARSGSINLVDLRENLTTVSILNSHPIRNTSGSVIFFVQVQPDRFRRGSQYYKVKVLYALHILTSSSCTEALEPAGQPMRYSISLVHVVTAHALSLSTPDRLVKRC